MAISKKDIEKFKTIDAQALEMYNEGKSLTLISNHFGIKRQSLSKRLKSKYNLIVLDNGKKYVNSDFFEIIDSEEKAYWLGFLFADGYISDNNKIELCLKESDKEHIENFKLTLDSKHKISKKKNILNNNVFYSYRISIQDQKLNKDLHSKGCINNKSLVCKFPKIKDEFLLSFIRGYFDGDGCIFFDNRFNTNLPRAEFACGSIDFITELKDILYTKFNLFTSLYSDKNIYSLRFGRSNEARKFLNLIYKNSPKNLRLNRKYELYTHMPS